MLRRPEMERWLHWGDAGRSLEREVREEDGSAVT